LPAREFIPGIGQLLWLEIGHISRCEGPSCRLGRFELLQHQEERQYFRKG
jgi:hypothetical protein